MEKMKFTNHLAKYRADANLTQQDIAHRLGVAYRTVQKWEGGDSIPRADIALCVAKILGVEIRDIWPPVGA
jgi:DNA-binding XRE family transcriptional regulator